MTRPRQHLAGQVVLFTRRTSERRYFLRPDKFINDAMAYDLARAALRHGQKLHAAMAMSNHFHAVFTDETGERSEMARDALASIARARNKDLGRKGHFWESGTYGDCVLLDTNAIERMLVYTWANPVRAGLVSRVDEWPGYMIRPRDWGKTIRVYRPSNYYGDESPEFIDFTPQPPPGYEEWPLEETIAHYERLIARAETEIHAERVRDNWPPFLGVDKVLMTDSFSAPGTPDSDSKVNPEFATLDPVLLKRARKARKAFYEDYAQQRRRWKRGKARCIFPPGTIWLRRHGPVKCRKTPSDAPSIQIVRIAKIRVQKSGERQRALIGVNSA
ncbi:hypothetical protein [Lujinxingia litoralis]|uniref:hypothetical protein n=1 Tax=Lujinxingia litoralis TaxID=2211119 RepID=UPI0011B93D43|nr:hypothetical protein [Lujinxingia litoralis]